MTEASTLSRAPISFAFTFADGRAVALAPTPEARHPGRASPAVADARRHADRALTEAILRARAASAETRAAETRAAETRAARSA